VPEHYDPNPAFGGYAHPKRLVSTEWLSANIGNPSVKAVESNEDLLLYDIGHIPGARKIDWNRDLHDPLVRDFVDGVAFSALMRDKGIDRQDTIVLYGDQNNRWAAYTAWVFALFGHEDVRLLDGGRDAWHNEDRETTLDLPWPAATPSQYPVVERDDSTFRVFADAVGRGAQLLDVRTPAEFAGEAPPGGRRPDAAQRRGHIPDARNIPWETALGADGHFCSAEALRRTYQVLSPDAEVVVYCHTGEQAGHSWFVLTHLLGYAHVRVYDGSWVEWGNAVRAAIARDR